MIPPQRPKDNSYILDCVGPLGWQMLNDLQMVNIWHLLNSVLAQQVPGEIIEAGCFTGRSAALIQKILEARQVARKFHVYDSFEGLSEFTDFDYGIALPEGDLAATIEQFKKTFADLNLELPQIHKGWINETMPSGLPPQIAFAHLDLDLYEPTFYALAHLYPRLSKGAIVVIDDYYDAQIHQNIDNKILYYSKITSQVPAIAPGVQRAADRFLADKAERPEVLYAGNKAHCYFVKK